MEARIVDLRYRMKSGLEALDRGESVTLLHRGKPRAQRTPIESKGKPKPRMKPEDHPAVGKDVEAYPGNLRKPGYTWDGPLKR